MRDPRPPRFRPPTDEGGITGPTPEMLRLYKRWDRAFWMAFGALIALMVVALARMAVRACQ